MKLNLRDYFWLIFVAAVLTMWWIDRSKLADRLRFYEAPKTASPAPLTPKVIPPLPYQLPTEPPPSQRIPALDPVIDDDPFPKSVFKRG
jgi:hypothetical protein